MSTSYTNHTSTRDKNDQPSHENNKYLDSNYKILSKGKRKEKLFSQKKIKSNFSSPLIFII
jgi:hypothetical protein